MSWEHATVTILTCDRDKELLDLCVKGIKKFWPGINISVLHDKDESRDTDLPDDIRELARRIPFLRKVFDLPYTSKTDQIYCIDSDCMLVREPLDWPMAAHLAVGPGSMGKVWLRQGSDVWQALGWPQLDESVVFCGGCWSARRSEMFDPNREIAIEYIRECVRRGHHEDDHPGVVLEQCLLNGLWHHTYPDAHLSNEHYPLYQPNPNMTLYHLSDVSRGEHGPKIIEAYRKIVEDTQ